MADKFVVPISTKLEEKTLQALEGISDILSNSKKREMAERNRILELEKKKMDRDIQLRKLFVMSELGPRQYKYLKVKNK